MSFFLIHAILRYIRTHTTVKNGDNVSIHWRIKEYLWSWRERKINPKNYWQSVYVRVHVQKDWIKNLGSSKNTMRNVFSKSVTCLYYCACVLSLYAAKTFGCLELILFFTLQMKNKEYRIENLLSRCRYHFGCSVFACTRVRSHNEAVPNLQILMKFESIVVIFLAMMLPSNIQLTSSTAIFLWEFFFSKWLFLLGLLRVVSATWNHFVCFMGEGPFWILKAI